MAWWDSTGLVYYRLPQVPVGGQPSQTMLNTYTVMSQMGL